MTPVPYIFFNGQCRAATRACAEIFGIRWMIDTDASDPDPH